MMFRMKNLSRKTSLLLALCCWSLPAFSKSARESFCTKSHSGLVICNEVITLEKGKLKAVKKVQGKIVAEKILSQSQRQELSKLSAEFRTLARHEKKSKSLGSLACVKSLIYLQGLSRSELCLTENEAFSTRYNHFSLSLYLTEKTK